MSQPVTRDARAGDVSIAYQVIGEGPADLVWSYGLASNIEALWEEPSLAVFLPAAGRVQSACHLRPPGLRLRDRGGVLTTPTLEERADDILAVLDAVDAERASILGVSEGAGLAAVFASTHPERTTSIILYGTVCRLPDIEHPLGWNCDEQRGDGTSPAWAPGGELRRRRAGCRWGGEHERRHRLHQMAGRYMR